MLFDEGETCACDADAVDLDRIIMQLNCAQCGGGHTAMVMDLDGLTAALEWLRDHRIYLPRTTGERAQVVRMKRPAAPAMGPSGSR
jgi:hypothetical protein